MRILLVLLFAFIFVSMLAVTAYASFERNVFDAGRELMPERWFQATLCDAYFGFVTFYVWVAYKERKASSRLAWFVLIMCLGNIAMSVYMLMQLIGLPRNASLQTVLLRNQDT